jgi:anti-anti-sigma factor
MSLPTSLEMSEYSVGDVLILKLKGRLGLETMGDFRQKWRKLLAEGIQQIVVDVRDVPCVDSAGIGELVNLANQVSEQVQGGKVAVIAPDARNWRGFLKYTWFTVFDDEVSALTYFKRPIRYCRCLSCGSFCGPPILGTGYGKREQTCPRCDARFEGHDAQDGVRIVIERFSIQTYEQEYFEVVSDCPYILRIVGRLNLFASAALDKVWRAIPSPRRVIFDLRAATNIDAPGWEALLRFLRKKESSAKAVISLEGRKPENARFFLTYPDVYPDRKAALAALGDLSDTPPWTAEIVDKA